MASKTSPTLGASIAGTATTTARRRARRRNRSSAGRQQLSMGRSRTVTGTNGLTSQSIAATLQRFGYLKPNVANQVVATLDLIFHGPSPV
jgi:hypothetical protein